MGTEEIFSWVACALVVTGIIMLGHKQKSGFVIIAAGGIITAVLVFLAGDLSGLVAQNVIAVVSNVYSWIMWLLKEKKP